MRKHKNPDKQLLYGKEAASRTTNRLAWPCTQFGREEMPCHTLGKPYDCRSSWPADDVCNGLRKSPQKRRALRPYSTSSARLCEGRD